MRRLTILAAVLALSPLYRPPANAQQPSPDQTREANLKAYVELLRKDIKKDKVAILAELMDLSPAESAKFWPVYGEYDKALSTLADERIAMIRMYAENFGAMTDEVATKLAHGVFDLDSKRIALKREYFQKMGQALSPKLAARFIQIENQLEKIIDLQIASSLPVIE
jgi:hypothetical protein